MKLKYGMNPYQKTAEVIDKANALALLNGNPSIINVLDGLNAWQLVKEAAACLGRPAATSFKHVTPSGVALGRPLSETEKRAYLVKEDMGSDLAAAYARARGADRLASFGDFIALSHDADEETAGLIKAEVSDGIIAPGYSEKALEILKGKKKGAFVIFQIDRSYVPGETESREVFGITVKQARNNLVINRDLVKDVVTKTNLLSDERITDVLLGMITLKYTQSNSICLVHDGQVIGIGSGQQSRILCSTLALNKANVWCQKMNMDYSLLDKAEGLKRTDLDQIIEQKRREAYDTRNLLKSLKGLCLCSDGFFPQKDNIDLAGEFGVQFIASPMGSIRDREIIEAADARGITFINTGVRLFHH